MSNLGVTHLIMHRTIGLIGYIGPLTITPGGCLGGAVVPRRTRDQKVAGLTPSRGAIKSTRSTQPSIPPG